MKSKKINTFLSPLANMSLNLGSRLKHFPPPVTEINIWGLSTFHIFVIKVKIVSGDDSFETWMNWKWKGFNIEGLSSYLIQNQRPSGMLL